MECETCGTDEGLTLVRKRTWYCDKHLALFTVNWPIDPTLEPFEVRPRVKFGPAHFPVGTKFCISADRFSHSHNLPTVLTVKAVHRNGIDSYVVETDIINKGITSNPERPLYHAWHISHITDIIKRGDGPLKIEHGYFGVPAARSERLEQDVVLMRLSAREADGSLGPGMQDRRRYLYTGSLQTTLVYYTIGRVPAGIALDYGKLERDVLAQSWCVEHKFGRLFKFHRLTVKQLRRYIDRNWTRWQAAIKPLRREEDRQAAADYQAVMDDFDRALDEKYGSLDEEPPVPGCRDADGHLVGDSDYDARDYREDPIPLSTLLGSDLPPGFAEDSEG